MDGGDKKMMATTTIQGPKPAPKKLIDIEASLGLGTEANLPLFGIGYVKPKSLGE